MNEQDNDAIIRKQSQLIADELGIPNPNESMTVDQLIDIKNRMKEYAVDDLSVLNTESYRQEFPTLDLPDICWAQHQIILKQKIEIAELREALFGHHASLPNEINRY